VGVLLIIMAVFSFGGKDFASKFLFFKFLFCKIEFGKTASKADYRSRFTTGQWFFTMRNGLYGFNASLAGGGIWQGALYMALFGLGTLPFMFAIVLAEIS
jgi:sulfite exporter TauE/SafE